MSSCRDVDRINEEWFADTDAVREKVGLQDDFAVPLRAAASQAGPVIDELNHQRRRPCSGLARLFSLWCLL